MRAAARVRQVGGIIYEKDSQFHDVPCVPIKGRTIWVIGSTLVVFIIVPRRGIEILSRINNVSANQPTTDLN